MRRTRLADRLACACAFGRAEARWEMGSLAIERVARLIAGGRDLDVSARRGEAMGAPRGLSRLKVFLTRITETF